ncbi:hypothetical protein D3C80_1753790 [compost metagenome]
MPAAVTNIIGCFTSAIKVPTHGAKSPLIPILIDCGINPLLKSAALLVSRIKAPVSSTTASKSFTFIAFIPLCKTVSKLS